VHFDPVGTEQTSQADIREFTEDDVLARQAREVVRDQDVDRTEVDARPRSVEETEEDEEEREEESQEDDELDVPSARKVREGLPARFRMRHTPHYVDELLGDAPPRTVREIPISEIESPIDDQAELADLEQSIRRLGIIEPLLVASRGRRGAIYRVIAGMRRLRAAQRVGLGTVPCLVHDVHEGDEGRMTDLRDAAMQRLTVSPPPPEPQAVPQPVAAPTPVQPAPEQTIGEAALGLEFVASLLPAMNAAGSDRLRWGVLTDLAAVELSRAKLSAAAEESLRTSHALDRASLDPRALVLEAVSAVATEARLRGVRVDVSAPDEGRDIFLDGARCRSALTGLLHALLALAPQGGTLLGVSAQITTIRPALIVACLLQESDPELSPEALGRFFEAGWREHPCGTPRAPILGAFAHTARAHGGRVDVKIAGKGCLVTFVVPRLEG
jgi:hypothetical protein